MFKLTLQDIALEWFETESPTWLTEDQMKQAFLKRFNPWGDTRHQQQDAWNKLKFDEKGRRRCICHRHENAGQYTGSL